MHNPSRVRMFFERMSASVSTTQVSPPPLELLHSQQSNSSAPAFLTGSLQDRLTAGRSHVSSMQWEVHDFGVGLPPAVSASS